MLLDVDEDDDDDDDTASLCWPVANGHLQARSMINWIELDLMLPFFCNHQNNKKEVTFCENEDCFLDYFS